MAKKKKAILLQDLLNLTDEECARAKVKFDVLNGIENPIDIFKSDPEILNTQWEFWNPGKTCFKVGQIAICLAQIEDDKWLLTTIKTVKKNLDKTYEVVFKRKPLKRISKLFGRVVVRYRYKKHQEQVVSYVDIINKLEVIQVLPSLYDEDCFPGYNNVCLSYHALKRILDEGKSDWLSALKNQKAVFVLTDNATGKQFVGSATGANGMLLKRWKAYLKNGHGGNMQLKTLIKKKKMKYIKENFQFSIIEEFDVNVEDQHIIEREVFWKTALRTREFGYNSL